MSQPIHRRAILAGGLAMAGGRALAQADPGLVHVALKTPKGTITLALNADKAPITTRNFLRYVDAHRYDKATFYRTSHAPGDATRGFIEGGLENINVFKPIAHESTVVTGLTHKDGTISMAANRPGTANADFFILVGDNPGFDATPGDDAKQGFAAFGQVTDGMDVVRAIYASPTSPTKGLGIMRGEMLAPTVPIVSARRAGA